MSHKIGSWLLSRTFSHGTDEVILIISSLAFLAGRGSVAFRPAHNAREGMLQTSLVVGDHPLSLVCCHLSPDSLETKQWPVSGARVATAS